MKPSKVENITILGATGSIGASTLDVLARHRDKFAVFALTAHKQVDKLAQLCVQFNPRYAVVGDKSAVIRLRLLLTGKNCRTEILSGSEALSEVAAHPDCTAVMAAIVGAAGLGPAFAAARAGKKILLANKETLVAAGSLFMRTAAENGAVILPVDSEHNAIFQAMPAAAGGGKSSGCLKGLDSQKTAAVILTASGGPFLDVPLEKFPAITPQMALKHPNWSMGKKISVDSATMMNKGLEVIEAHWLFSLPREKIEVVVHPQSIIHSMVRYCDGSVLAQMGTPDMRTPIAYCLGLPERIDSGVAPLDFARIGNLTFRQPETARFPCLKLAYAVLKAGGTAGCILNAANEEAVAAFLNGKIRFTDIYRVVEQTLTHCRIERSDTIAALAACAKEARHYARNLMKI